MTKKKPEETEEVEPVANAPKAILNKADDRELKELEELLEGQFAASPKLMELTLAKARRLQKCSQTVALAALLLHADAFNMDEPE